MDDVTKKRIERIEKDVAQLRTDMDAMVEGQGATTLRIEQVHGLVQQTQRQTENVRGEVIERAEAASAERRRLHAEQMKAFQDVVNEVRSARDAKIAELESTVALLMARMAELEKKLTTRQ
jgi:hypothetical protein